MARAVLGGVLICKPSGWRLIGPRWQRAGPAEGRTRAPLPSLSPTLLHFWLLCFVGREMALQGKSFRGLLSLLSERSKTGYRGRDADILWPSGPKARPLSSTF